MNIQKSSRCPSANEPKRTLMPWPSSQSTCKSATSHVALRTAQDGFAVYSLRPDQGVFDFVGAHDVRTVFHGVDWLFVSRSTPPPAATAPNLIDTTTTTTTATRNVPSIGDCCGRYRKHDMQAMQHANSERFMQVLGITAPLIDTRFSSARSVMRLVHQFVVDCKNRATMSIRCTGLVGIYIGGHTEPDGSLLCCDGQRLTPAALQQAIASGLASHGGGSGSAVSIIVCIGVCGGGDEWTRELRDGGSCIAIIESPLWGAGVPTTLPPSARKMFYHTFNNVMPLFMEARISLSFSAPFSDRQSIRTLFPVDMPGLVPKVPMSPHSLHAALPRTPKSGGTPRAIMKRPTPPKVTSVRSPTSPHTACIAAGGGATSPTTSILQVPKISG